MLVDVNDRDEAPVARADTLSGIEDTPREIDVAAELLANDADPEGGTLRLVEVTPPVHGALVHGPDGRLDYRPGPDFNGTDAFEYVVEDAGGQRATASVTLEVAPENDPPTLAPSSAGSPDRRPDAIDASRAATGWMSVDENTGTVGVVVATDVDDTTLTIAVSRTGYDLDVDVDIQLLPADLLGANPQDHRAS